MGQDVGLPHSLLAPTLGVRAADNRWKQPNPKSSDGAMPVTPSA